MLKRIMETYKYKLTNNYHGTAVTIRVPADRDYLTPAQVRRVRRVLCGVEGCQCSGDRGGDLCECGPDQDIRVTVDPSTGRGRIWGWSFRAIIHWINDSAGRRAGFVKRTKIGWIGWRLDGFSAGPFSKADAVAWVRNGNKH